MVAVEVESVSRLKRKRKGRGRPSRDGRSCMSNRTVFGPPRPLRRYWIVYPSLNRISDRSYRSTAPENSPPRPFIGVGDLDLRILLHGLQSVQGVPLKRKTSRRVVKDEGVVAEADLGQREVELGLGAVEAKWSGRER